MDYIQQHWKTVKKIGLNEKSTVLFQDIEIPNLLRGRLQFRECRTPFKMKPTDAEVLWKTTDVRGDMELVYKGELNDLDDLGVDMLRDGELEVWPEGRGDDAECHRCDGALLRGMDWQTSNNETTCHFQLLDKVLDKPPPSEA